MSVKNLLTLVLGVWSTQLAFSQEGGATGDSLEDFAFPSSVYYDKFHSDKQPTQEQVDLKQRLERLLSGLIALEEKINSRFPCVCGKDVKQHAEHCKLAKVQVNKAHVENLLTNFHTKSESEVQQYVKKIRKNLERLILSLRKTQNEREQLQERCLSYSEGLLTPKEDMSHRNQLFLFLDQVNTETQNIARELYAKITTIQRDWRLLTQKIHSTREFIYQCGSADETKLMMRFHEELQNEINDICAQAHIASHHVLLLQDQMHALPKKPEDALKKTIYIIRQDLSSAKHQFSLLSIRFTDLLVAKEKIPHYQYPELQHEKNCEEDNKKMSQNESSNKEIIVDESLIKQKDDAIELFNRLLSETKTQLNAKRTLLQDLEPKCKHPEMIEKAKNTIKSLSESEKQMEIDIAILEDENQWKDCMAINPSYQEIAEQNIAKHIKEAEDIFSEIEAKHISQKMASSKMYRIHIVEKGETLESLAKKYNTEVEEIEECNDISLPIEDGDLLRIPQNSH